MIKGEVFCCVIYKTGDCCGFCKQLGENKRRLIHRLLVGACLHSTAHGNVILNHFDFLIRILTIVVQAFPQIFQIYRSLSFFLNHKTPSTCCIRVFHDLDLFECFETSSPVPVGQCLKITCYANYQL